MDQRDDDIHFDFFDEPAKAEVPESPRARLPQRAGRAAGGGGGGAPATPARPFAPLVRLLLLVFFVIFLVLVFALLIQSCAGQSRHSAYASYMDKVTAIAHQSTENGKATENALTSSTLSIAGIVKQLQGVAAQEQQNVDAAQKLVAPGRLRTEQANLIEALQLRVSGVSGLAAAFLQLEGAKGSAVSTQANLLTQEADRLLASDVVWADLFLSPAQNQLKSDGVHDVAPPASQFLASPDQFVTDDDMTKIVNRLLNTGPPGGTCDPTALHGTDLVSVAALPNGAGGSSETLQPDPTLNTVTTSSSLIFQVTIHDGGNYQEVRIPIQLTIDRPAAQGGAITKTQHVQLIDPDSDQSVVFSDLGQVPFASQTKVTVVVGKVHCETNTANNSATYDVIFSLPS